MKTFKSRVCHLRTSEQGFTLPEVLVTILIMGIVFAIASSTWQGTVESRKVDSATNQLVSDLRLAHTSAINRLSSWKVVLTAGSPNYQIGPSGSLSPRSLPEGAVTATSVTMTFSPNGSVVANPSIGSIRIEATNDASKFHTVECNSATSRIKVVD